VQGYFENGGNGMKSIEWNLNYRVGIYWNEWCYQVYRDYYADIALDASPYVPTPDDDGLVWLQAHSLMRIFGPHIVAHAGNKLSMVCRVEVPTKATLEPPPEGNEEYGGFVENEHFYLAATVRDDLQRLVGKIIAINTDSERRNGMTMEGQLVYVGEDYLVLEIVKRNVRVVLSSVTDYEVTG